MKTVIFIAGLFAMSMIYSPAVKAQARVNVNINIGNQPLWGPEGYDYAQYYYMPDIDAYYDIPRRQFIYLDGSRWIFAPSLPPRFNYDLYRGYKVVINQPKPWMHPDVYRNEYGKYRGWYGKQVMIRDSRNEKYFKVKGHPMNGVGNQRKAFEDQQGNSGNRGNGRGHGRGHDKQD
ncbi:MAG TPA: hypothetical protein VM802_28325 [Chitinophaga sp.]|uniref:hypothetical protein n=1 Tax=Chitinophaga sp. TaxID=1869181 RepID=UPI002CFA577C|nr:hypothetical protein [Chitinophaga sp.]HVI48809.1 hypothetical protein [Chitinophaga sp.]